MDKLKFGGLSGKINSDASLFGFLANAFYDIKNSSPFTPYIGGGIGFAQIYVGQGTSTTGVLLWNKDNDTVFAYQLGAGVGINAGKNLTFDLGYRYFGTSDVKFDLLTADVASHNVLAGVRYKF